MRDENAWWLDIVFQPVGDDDGTTDNATDPDYSACDSCGTAYVRGVEQRSSLVRCVSTSPESGEATNCSRPIESYVFNVRDFLEE